MEVVRLVGRAGGTKLSVVAVWLLVVLVVLVDDVEDINVFFDVVEKVSVETTTDESTVIVTTETNAPG